MATADLHVHLDDPNALLTFRDEQGREWVAAAIVGPLLSDDGPGPDQVFPFARLKDRAFTLHRITVVVRD